jgi:hypothetical protein
MTTDGARDELLKIATELEAEAKLIDASPRSVRLD